MLSPDPRALQTPLKLFWCTKQYEDSNSPSRRDSFSMWAIGSQRCAWRLDVTYMMGLQFQDIQALDKDHRKGDAYASSPAPTEEHQRLLQASFFLLFHKGQSRLSGIKTSMGLLRLPALLPCLRRFWGEKADYFLVVPWPTDVRSTGEEGRFRFVLGIFPLIMFSTKREVWIWSWSHDLEAKAEDDTAASERKLKICSGRCAAPMLQLDPELLEWEGKGNRAASQNISKSRQGDAGARGQKVTPQTGPSDRVMEMN